MLFRGSVSNPVKGFIHTLSAFSLIIFRLNFLVNEIAILLEREPLIVVNGYFDFFVLCNQVLFGKEFF